MTPPDDSDDPFESVSSAARFLGCSEATVRNRDAELRPLRLSNGARLYRRSSLIAYLGADNLRVRR